MANQSISAPKRADIHIRISATVVDDYDRRGVFPEISSAARSRMASSGEGGTDAPTTTIHLVVTRKEAYALYEDALEHRATRRDSTTMVLSFAYTRLRHSIQKSADLTYGPYVDAPGRAPRKREWIAAAAQVEYLFAQLQIPGMRETARGARRLGQKGEA